MAYEGAGCRASRPPNTTAEATPMSTTKPFPSNDSTDTSNEHARRAVWDTYTSAWKASGQGAKLAALLASTNSACEYRDPLAHTVGQQALVDYMLSLHNQLPGAHFETTHFQAHHGRSIAKWNMCAGDGTVLSDGVSFGEYGADGLLLSMSGFFETPDGALEP